MVKKTNLAQCKFTEVPKGFSLKKKPISKSPANQLFPKKNYEMSHVAGYNTYNSLFTSVNKISSSSKCIDELKKQLNILKGNIAPAIRKDLSGFVGNFLKGGFNTLKGYKDLAVSVAGITNPVNIIFSVVRLGIDSSYRAEMLGKAKAIYNATNQVVNEANQIANALENNQINTQDIINYLEDLFNSFPEYICSASDIIANMNANPNALAEPLGELTTELIIQAGVGALTGGIGNGALKGAKLGAKGINLAKASGGKFKTGESLLQKILNSKYKRGAQLRQPRGIPVVKPKSTKTNKPSTKKTTPPKNNQTHAKNDNKGNGGPCKNCPTNGSKSSKSRKKVHPVNPIQGVKVLSGNDDTDFILIGDLPLVWERQYVSDSTVGRGRAGDAIGWYGQGWGNTWTLCLNVRPSEDLVQLIDAYGREINFPYIAIGSSFYSRYEDIRLHHDAPGQYRLTAGTSGTGDGIALHFGEAEPENLVYPRYTTYYCTGQSDSYGNRITLSYHQHADKAHLPQYIQGSVGQLIQLEFTPYKDTEHYRLVQVNELINLSQTALQQLPPSVQQIFATLSIPQHLDYAKQLIADNKAPTALIATKPLVAYRYSEQGDLTEVYRYQDQSSDLLSNNIQTIRPSRRYEWRNHIMIAHHFADGISSYYKYNKHIITGKVIENRINNGQTYHFDYYDGYTIVTEAKDTPNESQTIYHFNEELRWTGITDGNGNHTQFILDSFGRLIQQIDPDGHIQNFSYTGDNLTAINQLVDIDPTSQQPLWRTQQYTYSQGRLSNLIDPLGNSTHIQYDEHGQPTLITDANGHSTQIERDNKGRVSKQTLANGSTYRYEYDLVGNLTQQTDCSGYTTHYQYDDIGRLTQVTDPMGQTTQYRYDTTEYRTASPVQIRYPDGTQEQFSYDRQGRLLTYTDAKAQSTHYQYEIDDLPRQRTDALGHTLSYHYDNQRRLIRLTNENGEDWTFTYDKADNLISETRFDGTTAHYDYSKAGLLKHQLDTGLHHYYRYDRAGQLTDKYSLTDRHHLNKSYLTPKPPNHSDPYPYSDSDYQHHRQPILDKNRPHRLRYQYDMAGQLIKATSPHATTMLGYDPVGQLISETLQRHHSHAELGENETDSHSTLSQTLTHVYDELGNRTKTTLPDGKALNQLYYGSGHLYNQSLTDESGNIQEIRHSTTNRLHQEVTRQQGELLSSFGYDPMGRLTKQYSSNDSHIVIQRDYAYDKVGQLTHIASKTRLTQLVPNKPTQIIVNHYQRNHQYGYDTIGRLVSHKLSDYQHHAGVQERFAFDPASNRVPLPSDSSQSSQALSQPLSQIDAKTKRPTSLITQGKKIGYVYDRHGRVQFKTIVPVDKDGNELKQSSQSIVGYLESLQLFYNTNNELEKSVNIHQQGFEVTITTTLYYYDAFGRRVAKSSEVQKASKLNQQGRLVRFPDSLINLRRTEKSQRQSMLMLWDGNRQIQEYTKDHVFTTVYEQDSFVPVARLVWLHQDLAKNAISEKDKSWLGYFNEQVNYREQYYRNNPLERENFERKAYLEGFAEIKIFHYHTNHLGTPQEISNDKGDIVWLSYDKAWGESFNKYYKIQEVGNVEVSENELQPIKFQGQYFDIETGLHYNRFRYYDPDVGMFISRDPIELLGGSNTFQYAPNPTGWIDPLGLTCGNREKTVGDNPSITSRTGKTMMLRMLGNHELRNVTKQDILSWKSRSDIPIGAEYRDASNPNLYHPISVAHMGHTVDAVTYWNQHGKYFGKGSHEVRSWMLDPRNYRLQPSSDNCSTGAALKENYDMKPATGPHPRPQYGKKARRMRNALFRNYGKTL